MFLLQISPGVALSVTFARATCSRPQDAAALLSDYRAPLVHDSPNTALYGPSYDRAADDVAAVDAALQLLLLLQPVGFEGELQELHQRALSCPTGGPWGVGMASGAGADEDEGEVKGVAASAPAASPWRLQALRSRLLDPAGPPCVIVSGAPGAECPMSLRVRACGGCAAPLTGMPQRTRWCLAYITAAPCGHTTMRQDTVVLCATCRLWEINAGGCAVGTPAPAPRGRTHHRLATSPQGRQRQVHQ